jgi:methylenetetrahydrofolate dehydrogenase (NADP+)/methenyltetrahydrofolate cyclohydrolase
MKLIDGRALAEKVKDQITLEVFNLSKKDKPRPNLAIILVGSRPDSEIYVSLKEREAKKVGIDTHLYRFAEDTAATEIIETIKFLNDDPLIDALLVQLPLPKDLDEKQIMAAVDPQKDADGFLTGCPDCVTPPVIAGMAMMLGSLSLDTKNLTAAVVYNSEIFGQKIEENLRLAGFSSVLGISSHDPEVIKTVSLPADILVTAIGVPSLITGDMIKNGAVIIDIGITRSGAKVCGDVSAESVASRAAYLSPVPGGVGPLTIAFLFKNVLNLYYQRHGFSN